MVRIPIYDSDRSVGTGAEFFRPANDEAARDLYRGTQGLAQGVDQLGESLYRIQQRNDKFAAEDAVLKLEQKTQRDLDSAKLNITETGRGFHDANMAKIRADVDGTLSSVPDSQRQATEARLQRFLNDKSDELAKIEIIQSRSYIKDVTQRKVDQLENNVKTGVWDHTRGLQEANDFIGGIGLDPNAAVPLARNLARTVESAWAERLRTLNPAMFARETQKFTRNGPTASAGPVQQDIIGAAKTYDEDPLMMLTVAKLESNFDPNAGGIGTIRGLYQMSKAERTRLANILGVNDPEVFSHDPALASAGMAIILKEARMRLEANNIPVTPTTLWGYHFLGPAGIRAFMGSDPNADAYAVYSSVAGADIARKAFSTNGELLKPGMTVGQVIQKLEQKTTVAYKDVSKYVSQEPQLDTGAEPVKIMGTQFTVLTAKDLASEAAKAESDMVKRNAQLLTSKGKETIAGDTINAYDPVHRKAMDDAAATDNAQLKILNGDRDALAKYMAQASTGYLPKQASQAALALINSNDRTKQIQGLELAASVVRANPIDGLRLSGFGGASTPEGASNAAKIRDYVNLTVHGQIDPNEAARRVNLIHSDAWKVKETDIKGALDVVIKKRNWAEVDNALGLTKGMWWWKQETGPQTDALKARLEDRYQQYFRFHYLERGDVETAKANAIADLQRAANFTKIMGSTPQMMPFPPEYNYAPSQPLPDGKQIRDLTPAELKDRYGYISDQAYAAARETARQRGDKSWEKIKPTDVYLVPDGNTMRDVDAGVSAPRYQLWYKDASRDRQFARPEFTADRERVVNNSPGEDVRATRGSTPAYQGNPNAKDRFRALRKE